MAESGSDLACGVPERAGGVASEFSNPRAHAGIFSVRGCQFRTFDAFLVFPSFQNQAFSVVQPLQV